MCGQLSEGAAVGVVGEDPTAAGVVEATGGTPTEGTATEVVATGPDVVVAVGEPALVDLVRAGVDVPVLPVAAGASVRSVPRTALEPAVDRLLCDEFETTAWPLLQADGAPDATRALFDLTLLTDEPARISEYTVRDGEDHVATFRADGVVVATPTGSTGYARAAEGPVLSPTTDAVCVVPIAPFVTDADHWVLPGDGVGLVVERDETPVELLADGRSTGTVAPGEEIHVTTNGSLATAVVEESQRFYE